MEPQDDNQPDNLIEVDEPTEDSLFGGFFFHGHEDMASAAALRYSDEESSPGEFGHKYNPEKAMIAAIIERAILDFKQSDSLIRRSAESWVFSQSIEAWSLRWCLQQLDCPNALGKIHERCRDLKRRVRESWLSAKKRSPHADIFDF